MKQQPQTLTQSDPLWARASKRAVGVVAFVAMASTPWALAQLADPSEVVPENQKTAEQKVADAKASPEKGEKEAEDFMRFVEGEKKLTASLDTALIHYKNKMGVQVDLIGAVHIADAAYYDDLNKRFEDYDVVLFEMVGGGQLTKADLAQAGAAGGGLSMVQKWMSRSLDLEFQLTGIDYTKDNFVHADMSAEEFVAEQKEQNETMLKLLMSAASDPELNQTASGAQPGLADLLRILASPDMSAELKYLFGKQIDASEKMLTKWGEDTVILGGRNEVVIDKIDEMVKAGHKRIGVFYGGAHMPGIGEVLVEKKGFRKTGTEWLTAWDIERPEIKAPAPDSTEKPAAK